MPLSRHLRRMPSGPVAVTVALSLTAACAGCSGRGSAENAAVADVATVFLAAAGAAPASACDLLAPATLEELRSDGEECADALAEAAPSGDADTEPRVEVYGRDAMVRWGDETLFLALFDDGWRVTAAGCEPTGDDLPFDCAVEGR